MNSVEVLERNGPVILGQPHGGINLPLDLSKRLNARGLALSDTDWHINRLYDGLLPAATVVQAMFSRYVIDPNRDPSGASLYPGQNTTGLCPTTDFEGEKIYNKGEEPDEEEIEHRQQMYHSAYHAALWKQIERIRKMKGIVLLFDCHSIRSQLPFLFEGQLPEFNLGTNYSATCSPEIEKTAVEVCSSVTGFNSVINERFKGGWTIRYYGDPANEIHAIQLEISQRTYMNEYPPWIYNDDKAKILRIHLKNLLVSIEQMVIKKTNT